MADDKRPFEIDYLKASKPDYSTVQLAACTAAAVGNNALDKSNLTVGEGNRTVMEPATPNERDIPHVKFMADNGYSNISADIGQRPADGSGPVALDITVSVGKTSAEVIAREAGHLEKVEVSSDNTLTGKILAAKAGKVMSDIKSCMASDGFPAVKAFKPGNPGL